MKVTRALVSLVVGIASAASASSGCSAGEPTRNDEPIMAVQQRGVSECPQPDNQTEYCPADTACAYQWFCEPCCCSGCTQCQSVKAPQGTACDDGNPCTVNEVCNGFGTCNPGSPKNCDDNNPCTVDTCGASSGCVHTPEPSTKACNDFNACTTGDHCSGTGTGSCIGGANVSCDDGKVCTSDSCNPATGCAYTALPNGSACDDGNPCTVNTKCDASTLACGGGSPLSCDDGNPCTTEACGSGGCTYMNNSNACSDGNSCTLNDQCSGGSCKPGTSQVCNDNNPCTNDSCVAGTGCTYINKPNGDTCDDGNPCSTGDQCTSGVCAGTGGVNCNDNNPCTKNACSGGNCSYPPEGDGTPCDDKSKCTLNDSCLNGACAGSGAPDCDDNNPCTTDSCDPATGCKHVDATGPCNDGDPCTDKDTCGAAGKCSAGTPITCPASDECHKGGTCASATGKCSAETEQPDGTPCTKGQCKGGTCVIAVDGGTDGGSDAGDAATDGAGGAGGTGGTGTGGSTGGAAGTGAGGSGTGGSSGSAGAGTGGDNGVYVPDPQGCKCRVPSGRDATPGSWALAGLAAMAFAARRRRALAPRL